MPMSRMQQELFMAECLLQKNDLPPLAIER
jgi:hypothetical protein